MKEFYKEIEVELLELEQRRKEILTKLRKFYAEEASVAASKYCKNESERATLTAMLCLKVPGYAGDYAKRFGRFDDFLNELTSMCIESYAMNFSTREDEYGTEMFGIGFCGLGKMEKAALFSKEKGQVWELVAERAGAELQVIARKHAEHMEGK